jgi:hypothetical protein
MNPDDSSTNPSTTSDPLNDLLDSAHDEIASELDPSVTINKLRSAGSTVYAALDQYQKATFKPRAPSPTPKPADRFCQWACQANGIFRPTYPTVETVPPGVYSIHYDDHGFYLRTMKVETDSLIVLDDTASQRVVSGIRKFWESRESYHFYEITYKRGILLWGPAGCHAAGTEVVKFDGSMCRVEEVAVGDILMGPDGTPRTVLELRRGYDDMYRIHPTKGESFEVNGHHVLSLTRSTSRDHRYPSILNTTVNEYLNLSQCSQRSFKLYRSRAQEFFSNEEGSAVGCVMDPYLLGVWLGDGSESGPQITTADPEIRELCYAVAAENSLHVREERQTDSICRTYCLAGDGSIGGNPFRSWLRDLNLLENKHIPECYLTASIATRLNLLAGLIDTDGGNEGSWRASSKYEKNEHRGYFSITQKRKELSHQIVRLARSLGLGVTIREVTKTLKSRNFAGQYFRIHIFGDVERIPTRIPRKQMNKGRPNKDHLRTGIRRIESIGLEAYYGFTLSGDHLYLTSDFMVHHNSGKTGTVMLLAQELVALGGIVVFVTNPQATGNGLGALRTVEPERPIILVLEDIDELIKDSSEHAVLALLDGEYQISNVCSIATTNYPEKLGPRIINRPSRFDERIFIDTPNEEARRRYLSHITRHDPVDELVMKLWIRDSKGFSIAHLREMVIAVRCLGQGYDEVIERLKSMGKQVKAIKDYPSDEGGFRAQAAIWQPKGGGARMTRNGTILLSLISLIVGGGAGASLMRHHDARFVAATVRDSDHDFSLDVRQCVAALDAAKCMIRAPSTEIDPAVLVECGARANVKGAQE